ncbi:hypothetical protein AB0B50_40230 [Streptomyces sp. NPDC041068]|uniref:hypothetical protein n=1 Tax=Streptomyces sp. NPDC041068 TaxID=3155130 RepID=UPI0033FDCDB4
MTILRRHLSNGFTVLPTATLEDSRLSFRARGILAFLIAKPDDWQVRAESIAKVGKEGRDAVQGALRELRNCGYYRVITERLSDGKLVRITEVYDTAQEWAAEEYARQVVRRVERRLKAEAEQAPQAVEDGAEQPEDGFSGVGSPGAGAPAAGSSGFLVSNHTNYPQQNPPSPAAAAVGAPTDAPDSADEGSEGAPRSGQPGHGGCPAHPERPGRRCRACGTSPRKQREAQQQAKEDERVASRRAANERVLNSVRRQPDPQGLSPVARQRLEQIRQTNASGKEDRERDASI